jgi:hypothetical protein
MYSICFFHENFVSCDVNVNVNLRQVLHCYNMAFNMELKMPRGAMNARVRKRGLFQR